MSQRNEFSLDFRYIPFSVSDKQRPEHPAEFRVFWSQKSDVCLRDQGSAPFVDGRTANFPGLKGEVTSTFPWLHFIRILHASNRAPHRHQHRNHRYKRLIDSHHLAHWQAEVWRRAGLGREDGGQAGA